MKYENSRVVPFSVYPHHPPMRSRYTGVELELTLLTRDRLNGEHSRNALELWPSAASSRCSPKLNTALSANQAGVLASSPGSVDRAWGLFSVGTVSMTRQW